MSARYLTLLLLPFLFAACEKDTEVPVPTMGQAGIIGETRPLAGNSKTLMEGVYSVQQGDDLTGAQVVLKWNRTGVLIACENGIHFILQAGRLDSVVILQGYWRDGYSDATGLCNMYISSTEGGGGIVSGNAPGTITIRGAYGEEDGLPDQPFTLVYDRPFSQEVLGSDFNILAHRGGGRTSDRLPVSENCLAMFGFTERLGSTGIEIDVRLTTDGVAFLYHDADINIRLTQKGPLAGDISAYNWFQLSNFVRLIHGERIPSLEEALAYVIDSTQLNFVYLDMKAPEAVPEVVRVQKNALQHAAAKGRDVTIVMGVPATDIMEALMAQPDYQSIPSLCELTVEDVQTLNSQVWAPRWTLGTQNDLVSQIHSEGRIAVCWTIDNPKWIKDYLNNGQFDGLLTNFPYVVAYYHYIR